jgi:putative transposase
MELTDEMIEQLKADLKNAKTYEDILGKDGAIKKLIKGTFESRLSRDWKQSSQNT